MNIWENVLVHTFIYMCKYIYSCIYIHTPGIYAGIYWNTEEGHCYDVSDVENAVGPRGKSQEIKLSMGQLNFTVLYLKQTASFSKDRLLQMSKMVAIWSLQLCATCESHTKKKKTILYRDEGNWEGLSKEREHAFHCLSPDSLSLTELLPGK